MIEQGHADALLATLSRSADEGNTVSPEAFFYFYDYDHDEDFTRVDGIAIVDIKGGLFKFRLSRIRRQIERARKDASVRAILLNVDSAGGTVADTFDLADLIFETRLIKPVWASVTDSGYSAAYALASSAERLSLTRTAGVGSVGVIATHVEFSEADRMAGVKFTTLTAGERKADLIESEPLNDTARDLLQAELDRLRIIFAETVSRNRGMTTRAVLETEAGIFYSNAAVGIGFADSVETYADTLEGLRVRLNRVQGFGPSASTQGSPMTEAERQYIEALNAQNIAQAEARGRESTTPAAQQPEASTDPTGTISIDAARSQSEQAATEARRVSGEHYATYIAEVEETCRLAGHPERAIEFAKSNTPVAQVRTALLETAAAADAATNTSGQHSGAVMAGGTRRIDRDAIYASRMIDAPPSDAEAVRSTY